MMPFFGIGLNRFPPMFQSVVTVVHGTAQSINYPGTTTADDVALLYDFCFNTSGAPTPVTPSGFTSFASSSNATASVNVSAKLLNGTEGGGSISGATGNKLIRKFLVILRPNKALTKAKSTGNGTTTGASLVNGNSRSEGLIAHIGDFAAVAAAWDSAVTVTTTTPTLTGAGFTGTTLNHTSGNARILYQLFSLDEFNAYAAQGANVAADGVQALSFTITNSVNGSTVYTDTNFGCRADGGNF